MLSSFLSSKTFSSLDCENVCYSMSLFFRQLSEGVLGKQRLPQSIGSPSIPGLSKVSDLKNVLLKITENF